MRMRLTALAAVLGLLAMSGVALAADEDTEDTVFNFGYDSEAGVLVWNTTPTNSLYDCTLENGPLATTYTRVPSGVVLVDELAESGDPVWFPARPQEELEGLTAADGPAPYEGADGECGLSGGSVTGPNGQVNHGMFMKLFNSMFEGPGRGCVVRHLAQSDLGKGDQQVKASEADPDTDSDSQLVEEGSIEFETVLTDCIHGNDDDEATEEERGPGNRPDHAANKANKGGPPEGKGGPPEDRGNSGSAPGRNK